VAAVTTSVVLVVHNQPALTRACVESLQATRGPFELCVVDNASDDETVDYLDRLTRALPLRHLRNEENVGLIRALNQGAQLATGELLCFLHNDTELRDPRWLERLQGAVASTARIGLAGLYGVQRVRRDGRYAGRTIVHCLEGAPTLRGPRAEVAVVDGVCLFLARAVLEAVGGFDEGYGFFHGYDRDLSFAVREQGLRCAVVNAPFVHRGGGTRTGENAPVAPPEDLAQRQAALARFSEKWAHRLPCDVRRPGERARDWLRALRKV
jgi:GT2 family glycosyltransferase